LNGGINGTSSGAHGSARTVGSGSGSSSAAGGNGAGC
jgi:hypothetical protein